MTLFQRHKTGNIGVDHGAWGENCATEYLRLSGWEIVERNARPCPWDRRLEVDLIAYDRKVDAIVFVEVKQHARHRDGESRLRSIDRRKLRLLRLACNSWRLRNRWTGNYRFDVIEVFGEPGTRRPEIDHIRHVNLFQPFDRTVDWSAEDGECV